MPMNIAATTRGLRRAGLLGAGFAAFLAWADPAWAQSFSPYSDFQAMTPAELATLQVKLTFVGTQGKAQRTLAFTSTSNTLDLSLFVPFRRPDFDYGNDEEAPVSFQTTTAQLDAMIDSVGTLPGVTDGGVDTDGFLSFALLNTAGGTRAFESVVDLANGRGLMARMREALGGNATAVRRLDELACALDLAPTATPSDATGGVAVTLTGVRLDRRTGEFVGRVRVTNNSGSTLVAPLTLVADLQPNVRLKGETGHTCRIYPVGRAYVDLPVGGGLVPGASVQQVLRFENPDLDPIVFQARVFSGPGAR